VALVKREVYMDPDGESARIVETWNLRDPKCPFVLVRGGKSPWDIAYKPEYLEGGDGAGK